MVAVLRESPLLLHTTLLTFTVSIKRKKSLKLRNRKGNNQTLCRTPAKCCHTCLCASHGSGRRLWTTERFPNLPMHETRRARAVLAMWSTNAHLHQAVELFKAWGFRYVNCYFAVFSGVCFPLTFPIFPAFPFFFWFSRFFLIFTIFPIFLISPGGLSARPL